MDTASSSSNPLSSPGVKFQLSGMGSPSLLLSSERLNAAKSPQSLPRNSTAQNRSAYTPIFTPKPGDQSGSMVLLSPSRTITETLTTLATSTGQQLEEVWDEVGYSPEDRASQLSDLLVQFRDICERKIAEERGVAETFRQTIAEAKDELKRTSKALKSEADPKWLLNTQNNSAQTLMDELATLDAALEGLRAAASAAREDLKECRDYLVEAHEALGLEMDPRWRDIESDLTSERREAFHLKKTEMKEELSSRMAAVIQLVRDCQQMMHDLRIEVERDGSELDRRIAGSLVRSKDGSFIMASKFRSETCVGISAQALEELTQYVAELHGEKRRRKERLQHLGAEIAILWEKLRVPEEDQLAFTESVQGLGTDTIEKGEVELNRLLVLKARMIGSLIAEARETITVLWEQVNATPQYRRSFEPFRVTSEELFNDELLAKHEDYIGMLRERLEQMKPILRLIERREVIVRERVEYEELQKDSERLKQRGAAMTRQLMEEEKMAKRIKRELPKLTELLEQKLQEWKDVHNEDFLYSGESYADVMERQEEEWTQYKAEETQRKLQKKQQEKAYVENRYATFPSTGRSRPLADGHSKQNAQPKPQSRTREPTKARAQRHARMAG